MRYAFISDIHSNLEALEACLAVIDREAVDSIVCLGDIVGYGASPNECLDLVRERSDHAVIGNHDAAVVGRTLAESFNGDARAAVEWTQDGLTAANRDFLLNLPYTRSIGDGILLAHSSPAEPAEWHYIFRATDAARELDAFSERVCFIGHTHFPAFFVLGDSGVEQFAPPALEITPDARALVNVGSVGQPRDGDPRAAFALYAPESGSLEIRRVTYDVGRVQHRIFDSELPRSAAERLAWGV